MIAYFPGLYPDELFYSTVARYYSHLYPSYNMAIEKLCINKNSRIDIEFGLKTLNKETRSFFEKTYGLRSILLNHTMFLQYAMFETNDRRMQAEAILLGGEGDIQSALRFPKNKNGTRFLRYCPLCFKEDKQKFGEAYWHKAHQIRGVDVCNKHGCFLHNTNIEISAKSPPRLWVADDIVVNCEADLASEVEQQFADYAIQLMEVRTTWNCPINKWLISKLEGTKYISARGKRKFVNELYSDMLEYYKEFGRVGIEKQHQLVKLFTGYNNNFLDICMLLFFLKVSIKELENPYLPKESQTERFDKQVEQYYQEGLGCYRIARKVGSSPTTALKANSIKDKKQRNYSNRAGATKQNWEKMDKEMLVKVKELCEKIYTGDGDRPKRVTRFAVTKAMGWPDKRLNYLPKCKELVQKYSKETIEEYWARECVWAYEKIMKESVNINWRQLRDMTNMTRENFERCKKFLNNYIDAFTSERIKELI